MKLDIKKMDLDSLDELIGKCEDAMCHPFKKKKEATPEVEPEAEEASDEQDSAEKPELSEMDMDELLGMYEEMKAKG